MQTYIPQSSCGMEIADAEPSFELIQSHVQMSNFSQNMWKFYSRLWAHFRETLQQHLVIEGRIEMRVKLLWPNFRQHKPSS